MATYLVALKMSPGPSAAERYASIVDQLPPGEWWAETGAVIIVNDPAGIDAFTSRILNRSLFDRRVDTAAVFDLENREARAGGAFVDFGLFNIVPWLVRI
jgi:hypothetical protein